jgi:tetratricopeptide (TPR) repeat protein
VDNHIQRSIRKRNADAKVKAPLWRATVVTLTGVLLSASGPIVASSFDRPLSGGNAASAEDCVAGSNPAIVVNSCSQVLAFGKALALRDRITVLISRGRAYLQLQAYQSAIDDATQVLRLDSRSAEAYVLRGVSLLGSNLDLALINLNKAVTLAPNYVDAIYNRGIAFHSLGDCRRAMADFQRVIKLDESSINARYALGTCFQELKEYGPAIDEYTKALKIDLDRAEIYYNRSAAYTAIGQVELALTDLDNIIAIAPKFAPAYFNRAVIYLTEGRNLDAIRQFDIAIQIDPSFIEAIYNRGVALRESGQYDKAIQDLSQVISTLEQKRPSKSGLRFEAFAPNSKLIESQTPQSGETLLGCAYLQQGQAFHAKGSFSDAADSYYRAIAGECESERAKRLYVLANKLLPL